VLFREHQFLLTIFVADRMIAGLIVIVAAVVVQYLKQVEYILKRQAQTHRHYCLPMC
jgi:hypothetical protein